MAWWNSEPDDPNKDEGPGFLTSTFSNPWASIPLAILSGLGAAANPNIARGVGALNGGLEMGVGFEGQAQKQKKQQRLSDALSKLATATTPSVVNKTGVDPNTTTFSLPDANQHIGDPWAGREPLSPAASLPSYQATEEKPIFNPREQEYLKARARDDASAAFTLAGQRIFRQPQTPHFDRDPNTGQLIAVDPQTLAKTVISEGTPKEPTYHYVQDEKGLQRVANKPNAQAETIAGVGGKTEPNPPAMPSGTSAIAMEMAAIRDTGVVPARLVSAGMSKDPSTALKSLTGALQLARQEKIDEKTAMLQVIAAGKAMEGVKNPSDWMRYNETTKDVETAPTDIAAKDLKAGGYREIKSLKDRERILSSGMGLDLQFQKVKELADQYKKTSAISLKAGQLTGGQLGSAIGASMEGTGRQMIQFLEKELGGVRAAGSKPLLDAASSFLLPGAIDSNELVDLKIQGLQVLVDGLKDAPRRAAFGLGIDPRTKEEVSRFVNMVRQQGAKERGEKPPPPVAIKTEPGAQKETAEEVRKRLLGK